MLITRGCRHIRLAAQAVHEPAEDSAAWSLRLHCRDAADGDLVDVVFSGSIPWPQLNRLGIPGAGVLQPHRRERTVRQGFEP